MGILLFTIAYARAAVVLTASPDLARSIIALRWNMADHYQQTAYVLLKSFDGVVWEIAAANPIFRNYSSNIGMLFNDEAEAGVRVRYKVKIYDPEDHVVAMSNTTETVLPAREENRRSETRMPAKKEVAANSGRAWNYAASAQKDFLYVTYRGAEKIKGVINAIISDTRGKVRIRFRQASNNPVLKIPISNLQKGNYSLQLVILDQVKMMEQFALP